jgi:large subunit ribosomal protein L1
MVKKEESKAEAILDAVEAAEIAQDQSAEIAEETFAKAGKRSKRVIEEEAAEVERKERAAIAKTEEPEKKGPRPVTRSKLARRGKNYRKVAEKIDAKKVYAMDEAVKLATETNPSKFDASVEVHFRLNVDPRQADQNIRATVKLPNGNGKTVRVAVFAPEDQLKDLKADIKGDETFLKQLDKEEINFDILITLPAYMPKLGKYARLLGPKGLMPNPKTGTVATDLKKAVEEAKGGKIEYRVDKQAIVHLAIGKVSFGAEKLSQNVNAVLDSLKTVKPTTIKGAFVKSISVSTTQGPSIKVENTLG